MAEASGSGAFQRVLQIPIVFDLKLLGNKIDANDPTSEELQIPSSILALQRHRRDLRLRIFRLSSQIQFPGYATGKIEDFGDVCIIQSVIDHLPSLRISPNGKGAGF